MLIININNNIKRTSYTNYYNIRIFRSHNTKQLLCSWHVEIENDMFIE